MPQQNHKSLSDITVKDIDILFSKKEKELHQKVDETRDAYFGFIFPINRNDFKALSYALNITNEVGGRLYEKGKSFSSFRASNHSFGQLTNHIVGSSILALRGKDLNNGLSAVTDNNLSELVKKYEGIVLEIAEVRQSWFGRIYFPAAAFSNAITVFGGKVTPDAIYDVASNYGFASMAGVRKTVRGDFGIGVWMTLLGNA